MRSFSLSLRYDFCQTSYREKNISPVTEVIVFHDDFDRWGPNTSDFTSINHNSAQWADMYNAEASDSCGYNTRSSYKEYTTNIQDLNPIKASALVFNSVLYRYAVSYHY